MNFERAKYNYFEINLILYIKKKSIKLIYINYLKYLLLNVKYH